MPSADSSDPALGVLADSAHRPGEIARNRELLERAAAVAERFAAAGEAEDAVAAIATGATLTNLLHPGVLASERMEAVLRRIAAGRLEPLPARARSGEAQRILHVATETYDVGGHTRGLVRWIGRDAGRVHSVVTTAQRTVMPAELQAAVEGSGGTVTPLHPAAPWLERARSLRALSAEADVVVLHTHWRDPLPVLAFAAAGARPPVITFNHADHMFWLGYSVTDVLMNVRDIPAHTRRGIAGERMTLATLPIFGGGDQLPREPIARARGDKARSQLLAGLRWPEDTVLLLSVGNQIKFAGPPGTTLESLVEPVFAELPRARLIAVGTKLVPEFERFAARSGGRVAALDRVVGLDALFSSADVYLESRPGGGGTTTAEAAAYGLPCLSHAAGDLEAAMICTPERYGNHVARSADEYRRELARLVLDPEHRAQAGARSRAAVVATDGTWEESVAHTYARAIELGPVTDPELVAPADDGHPMHLLTHFFQDMTRLFHPPVDAERAVTALELAERTPAVRGLFQSLHAMADNLPALDRQYATAFAAPGADPAELVAVVDEFRRLAHVQAAERFVLALRPADADAAVPVLEQALAAGADVDVDLVLDDDPWGARPEWSLAVLAAGASDAGVPAPLHVCGAAQPVALAT